MHIIETPIADLLVAEATPFRDDRGTFSRIFCDRELASVVGDRHIVQINSSHTNKVGAVRGLHYQHSHHAEMKMVCCIKGKVWDVAVDLRQGSPTFLQWHAQELTPDNALMMIIPEGFAHGFQVMEVHSEIFYLTTAAYTPEAEGGVRYNDPAMGIAWPLPFTDLSVKDQQHPLINDKFQGLRL